ncbi:hypothetical protein WR25_24254 [Diploscapter pachys]|uniref:Ig-like domain-containing protein n=1 Tax=Diploscapter pachys TaxID=2018661 RepID=A0A2A2LJX4_9BILA|nr:hypothetical protein WR25_24254 [Diploscapter pachys]
MNSLSTILSAIFIFYSVTTVRCHKRIHRGIWSLSRELSKEVDKMQLLCRHTDKEASVIWFNRDMEKINNNEAYEILPNGDLMIRNADFDRDTGVFTCVVANESGESRAEAFFYAAAPDDEEEAKRKRR